MVWLLFFFLSIIPSAAQAADEIGAPSEVKAFLPEKHFLIALERDDLNGDGIEDMLIVAQDPATTPDGDEYFFAEGKRVLRILAGQEDGSFRLVAESKKAVLCERCGGVFGDPLAGIEVGAKTFSIHHYGGSNWRWGNDFQFNYSRIDNAWQLVKATETSFHTSDPENIEEHVYTPKDFGKIDLINFDPETYMPAR